MNDAVLSYLREMKERGDEQASRLLDMSTDDILLVSCKDVYGRKTYYPECEMTKMFTELAGTKTITQDHIRVLKRYGYHLTIKQEEFLI